MITSSRAALKGGAATLALTLGILSAGSAAAQTTAGMASSLEAMESETIIVTGTLIKDPNLVSANPINVVGEQEILTRQVDNAEALLRQVPGIVPSIGSAVNNGNGGASFVNLRGLGANRNLVLIDGIRLAPAGLAGIFDVNNVPLALVQRVDILTGGASTTYGADAVSGVVNFITKRDFTGVDLTTTIGITEKGDGQRFRTDLTIGSNLADGRGNVVLGISYIDVDPVYQGDREISQFGYATATGAAGGSGTSVPTRLSGLNPTAGNFIANSVAAPNTCNPTLSGATVPGLPACANPQAGLRQALTDGSGWRTNTSFDAFNFNPYNIFQTPYERINIYSAGNYEVADGIEIFARGLYSNNTVETIIAPSGAFGLSGITVPLNNPYLSPAQRNAICAFDTDPGVGYTPRFTAAECAAAAQGTLRPGDAAYRQVTGQTLARRAVEVGPRISRYETDYFDILAGVRGDITDDIQWETSMSYGDSKNTSTILNYTLNSRVRESLLAGTDAAGNPVCFNPAAGCAPFNWFGPAGTSTPESIDFLTEPSTVVNGATLLQGRGLVSGSTGWNTPWAESATNFAVGAEYRSYTAFRTSDLLAGSGDLGGAGGAEPNVDGAYNVWEIYGELLIPIVQGRKFVEDFTLGGGLRYSSYSVDAPGNPNYDTLTWKVEGNWVPVEGLRLRGVYSVASRAPNITELFYPQNVELTNLSNDPCANLTDQGVPIPGRPVPTGTLRDVCIAQGASPAVIGFIQVPTAGQANATVGGNPLLQPEDSTSWTAGFVISPKKIANLSITADYYNIVVTNAISAPTPGDALSACFDAPAVTNPACVGPTGIKRDFVTGSLSGDPATTGGLFLAQTNSGRLETAGIDFTINWSYPINDDMTFNFNMNGNWTQKLRFQATPASVNRECVGYFSENCGSLAPAFGFFNTYGLSWKDIDFAILHRYVSALEQEPLDADPTQGGSPNFIGTLVSGPLAGQEVNFQEIPAKNYLDFSVGFNFTENLYVAFIIENLLNTEPPLVGSEAGSTAYNSGNTFPSTYDALGRRFAMTARLRF
jgi:outer membrane receptor protein involved in Fe transport